MGGLSRGKIDFAVGSGETQAYYGGLYGTYKHTGGYYADLVFKYFHMDNEIDTRTAGGGPVKGGGDSKGYSASLELGKRFLLNEKTPAAPGAWFVEPQGQLTYGHFNSAIINSSHGLETKFNGFDSCLGLLGTLFGYSTLTQDGRPLAPYVRANSPKAFKASTSYSSTGSAQGDSRLDGLWP